MQIGTNKDKKYTGKIESPIYEPSHKKPQLLELFDNTKTLELINEIELSNLPDSEREFMKIAAQRHTIINFQRVADYYAQSSELVQGLMENSALVIIDFDRAIELGYVKLSEEIANQYRADYGED